VILAMAAAAITLLPGAGVMDRIGLDPSDAFVRDNYANAMLKLRAFALLLAGGALMLLIPPVVRYTAARIDRVRDDGRELMRQSRAAIGAVPRAEWWLLAAITVIGAALRLLFIERPLLWDEGTTFFDYVMPPWWVALAWYPEPNNHVLHNLLASVSTAVFGPRLWALRLPAFLAGVAMIPAAWLAGRMLHERRVAWLAAALTAVSSALIAFSVNARGYTMIALFCLILVIIGAQLRKGDNTLLWVLFAVVGATGMLVIPVMLYPIAFVCVWLLACALVRDAHSTMMHFARRFAVAGIATLVLTVLLYAPVLIVSGPRALLTNEYIMPLGWSGFIARWPAVVRQTAVEWTTNAPLAIGIILGIALVVGLIDRGVRRARLPLLIGLAGPLALTTVLRVTPDPRIWLFLIAPCINTAAAGMISIVDRLRITRTRAASAVAAAAMCVLIVVLGVNAVRAELLVSRDLETESMPGGERIASRLATMLRTDDVVLSIFPSDHVLRYELMRAGIDSVLDRTADHASRALVVVNRYRGNQTAERVLEQRGLMDRVAGEGTVLLEEGPVSVVSFDLRPGG
jgi:hypothetical protein